MYIMNAPRKYGGNFQGGFGGVVIQRAFQKGGTSCPIHRSVKHQDFDFVFLCFY